MQTGLQADTPGYTAHPVTKLPPWHATVVVDVLFNNLATGLFMAAALSELLFPEAFSRVARVAYPIALALLLADLALLVFDLGDPLRFHHMLRLVKLSSPMSFGVWSLTVFSLPAAVAAVASFFPAEWTGFEGARRIAAVAGVVPALASAIYKGVLFSTSAQPVWKEARWLGGYLTSSAVMLGCAQLLTLAILLEQDRAVEILRPAVIVLLLLSIVPLGLLVANVRMEMRRIHHNHGQLSRASALALGGGVLIPLCLLFADSETLLLGAIALILIGSFVLRFVIVYAPHEFE